MSANILNKDPARWFREEIEPLADSFEPADVDRYVKLFTDAIGRPELRARYEFVRRPARFEGPDPAEVCVLSRVTLGADVAVTSVALDGVMRRFPRARIWFAGPRKNFELFEGCERIGHLEVPYRRTGTLEDRLAAAECLRSHLNGRDVVVVDPDSRLTQLGLMPVCGEERYCFFDSRSPAESGSLGALTARWVDRVFGVAGARAFLGVKPARVERPPGVITVSLGVGENPLKRISDGFERGLIELLAGRTPVLVDEGAGGEETERVRRAVEGVPNAAAWRGPFAAFASLIAASDLYAGYDSAGQHVAAACGVPLVTVFAGFPNERFFERWRPAGPGRIEVIRADSGDPLAEIALRLRADLSA